MTVIKMSLACFILLVYMGVFYFRRKRIPLASTRIFLALYITALINIIADGVTIYTVNHLDTVPPWFNYVWHVIFLLSILASCYLLFLYLTCYVSKEVYFSKTKSWLFMVPLIISAILIIFLPIEYIQTDSGNYSRGAKAFALYGGVICYLLLTIYYNVRYWKRLNKDKRFAIMASIIIFIVVSIIQMIFPVVLITAAAITAVTMGLLLSNENAEKYMDLNLKIFNNYALSSVIDEWNRYKKHYKIGLLHFEEYYTHDDANFEQNFKDCIKEMNSKLSSHYHQPLYRLSEGGFAFFAMSEEECNNIFATCDEIASTMLNSKELKHKIFDVQASENETSQEIINNLLVSCISRMNKMAYFDSLTNVKNRNAFEIDLKNHLAKEEKSWVLSIDLNNLKEVNDSHGHSYGDELLQATAKMLVGCLGTSGTVYRTGGDEFAAVWVGDNIQSLIDHIYCMVDYENKKRMFKIDFALGYASSKEENPVVIADEMMYNNKMKMKGRS